MVVRDTGGVDSGISGDAGVDAVGDVEDNGDGDSGVFGGCVNGQVDKDDEAKKNWSVESGRSRSISQLLSDT